VIDVTRAADRFPGGAPADGIESRYAFSFGPHYDPDRLRFGPLIACNEELLAPGAGFAPHPHREVEIVTWVVEGELAHADDAGHHGVIGPGTLQWLSAGTGVRHSERNASDRHPCRFVQMWLEPAITGGAPAYGTTREPVLRLSRLPGAELRVGGAPAPLPPAPLRYLHVLRGTLRLDGVELSPGDGARLTAEPARTLVAGGAGGTGDTDENVEYLVWALPAPAR
jgi:redox-sensitive bicupin YhaK (pirin superfamily)